MLLHLTLKCLDFKKVIFRGVNARQFLVILNKKADRILSLLTLIASKYLSLNV